MWRWLYSATEIAEEKAEEAFIDSQRICTFTYFDSREKEIDFLELIVNYYS